MSLQIGQQLGSFEIKSFIGKGGMGEVYRARDTRLKRDVAIKILPDEFSRDTDRVSRFQREAESLAALNHPNIAGIHDLQQSGDTRFLILEFVEGDTLADILKRRGALPVEEALQIAKQICEALEAAHERGIVHRDLKPANVKITPDGKVKVLDFGLAKAFAAETSSSAPSDSPTLSMAATNAGVILGTAAYMSPEQAKGRTVDRRTDVFAFGALLYEMLTTYPAFGGDDVQDVLSAVLKSEPEWTRLPSDLPASIQRLLRLCLQKDVRKRRQTATDVRIDIEQAMVEPVTAGPAASPTRRPWLALAIGSFLAVGSAASIVGWLMLRVEEPPDPLWRFSIETSSQLSVAANGLSPVAISRDGSLLAYGSGDLLFWRPRNSMQAKPLAGTEGAQGPFFSPDGQWIGYFAGNQLKKISIDGGEPIVLASTIFGGLPRGAVWADDGTIIYANGLGGLRRVSGASDGPAQLTTEIDPATDLQHSWPELLPGGKGLLYVEGGTNTRFKDKIILRASDTGQQKVIVEGTQPKYISPGFLLYRKAGSLNAVPFDPESGEVTGNSTRVLDDVASFTSSSRGELVYVPSAPGSDDGQLLSFLAIVDRNGKRQKLSESLKSYYWPRFSPDGQQIAVRIVESANSDDAWIYDLQAGTSRRLTFMGIDRFVWHPEGKRIAFSGQTSQGLKLFHKAADGSGTEEAITSAPMNYRPDSWSPDGKNIAFHTFNPVTGYDIWTVSIPGGKSVPLLQTPHNEATPMFSPDNRWIAYNSDESGRDEVYVQPFPGPGGKWQVTSEGGRQPVWTKDGKEIIFRRDDQYWAVEISTVPAFVFGKPVFLFEYPFLGNFPGRGYDVSADGSKFVFRLANDQPVTASTSFNVVLGFAEEIKRRLKSAN